MEIPLISKRQFNRFKKFLPVPSNAEKICARIVISYANWVTKLGRSWSEIPEKYGKFDTIRKRFARWSKSGAFRDVFTSLAAKAGKSNIAMIDSTTIKAHRTAASMRCDGEHRQVGRSVGGLTTKIHMIANIEKMPLDFCLTGGQVNDAKEGYEIIKRNQFRMKYLLADKAYDTDKIRQNCSTYGTKTCIPPKCNRISPAKYDSELYKKRRIIENMFGQLKDWRGIAMRFCRCAHTFDSFVCLALIQIFFYVR